MKKVYLITGLVESPTKYGHRALVLVRETEEQAIGEALNHWQEAEWKVKSWDSCEVKGVVPIGE